MIKYDNNNFYPDLLDDNNIDKIQIKMIPNNTKVLEIGCATGFMSEYLKKEKKCFVYGVEYNEAQAEVAKEKCDEILSGGIDDITLQNKLDRYVEENQKFDVIFMSQVIEHIAYPNSVLDKLKDWLADDGVLIISTVNVAHWSSRIKLLRGIWKYEEYGLFDNTHLRFFSIDGFEQDLISAGYEVVDEGYNVSDISPLFFIPKIRVLHVTNIFKILGLLNSGFYKWYCKKFRNLIGYQFVFKVKKLKP
ncbi:class I SAM-dependent methyltransferase [Aliarcobacter skirrowii]|uniref:class I SAM-dependent methyltransferase n=1 Tax=Aliarcobacter skirrowii TaxID=28200 RepID=UPI00082F3C72|nr:class I SAM-dependent methyltransferase [Aliarcobacter skirrowii]